MQNGALLQDGDFRKFVLMGWDIDFQMHGLARDGLLPGEENFRLGEGSDVRREWH